jgi:hypothetical protein
VRQRLGGARRATGADHRYPGRRSGRWRGRRALASRGQAAARAGLRTIPRPLLSGEGAAEPGPSRRWLGSSERSPAAEDELWRVRLGELGHTDQNRLVCPIACGLRSGSAADGGGLGYGLDPGFRPRLESNSTVVVMSAGAAVSKPRDRDRGESDDKVSIRGLWCEWGRACIAVRRYRADAASSTRAPEITSRRLASHTPAVDARARRSTALCPMSERPISSSCGP